MKVIRSYKDGAYVWEPHGSHLSTCIPPGLQKTGADEWLDFFRWPFCPPKFCLPEPRVHRPQDPSTPRISLHLYTLPGSTLRASPTSMTHPRQPGQQSWSWTPVLITGVSLCSGPPIWVGVSHLSVSTGLLSYRCPARPSSGSKAFHSGSTVDWVLCLVPG